jgi:hypothetical protein
MSVPYQLKQSSAFDLYSDEAPFDFADQYQAQLGLRQAIDYPARINLTCPHYRA